MAARTRILIAVVEVLSVGSAAARSKRFIGHDWIDSNTRDIEYVLVEPKRAGKIRLAR
jgi:hypothetical protein